MNVAIAWLHLKYVCDSFPDCEAHWGVLSKVFRYS